jgi:PAS domain S-box-containing protein
MKAKTLRFVMLVPAILALLSLLKTLFPAHGTTSQLFMTPITIVGMLALSITWFFYLSGYRYTRLIMLVEGLVSLAGIGVVFLGYFRHFNYPGKHFIAPTNEKFLLNLASLFLLCYLVQVMAFWLPRMKAKVFINAALAITLFIVLLSLFGHVYSFGGIPQETLLLPMPLGGILSFFVWVLVVYVHTNRMERLYLSSRIILSFATMFLAILGANAVIYHNISKTANVSYKVGEAQEIVSETYNLNFYLGSAQAKAQVYGLSGDPQYAAAYQSDQESYLETISGLENQLAQEHASASVLQSISTVAHLGTQVLTLGDSIVSNTSPVMTQSKETTTDKAMDAATDQVLVRVKGITAVYTNQLDQLTGKEITGASGIILGVSITSAFSILLFLFTPLFIRQTIHDLSTARDQLEESSRLFSEEKTRAETILSSISDGLFAVDGDGVITLFNHAAEEISGIKRGTALGRQYSDVLHFNTTLDFTAKALHRVTSHLSHNAVLSRADGKAVDVQVSASPVLNRVGTLTGAIIMFRDRSSEQALENAKDDFVSLASHQLRTPATATKQFLAMFLQGYAGDIDDRQRLFLQQAYDNNEIGIQIIEALLNITRLESNKFKPMKEKIDLNEFLQSAVTQHDVLAKKNNQTVKLVAPAKHIFIEADVNLLTMAVDNLITNALKYSHDDSAVTVHLSDGHRATIAVSDHGIGIKEEDIPKLFMRFSRLQDPQAEYVVGTGIGLYLVKQIAHKLHATIKVESVYGKGSTFTLTFNPME